MGTLVQQTAPIFQTADLRGDPLQIPTSRPIVLVFLRYIGCSICRDALTLLSERHLDIAKQGAEVWVVLPSPKDAIQEFSLKRQYPFRMISDESREIFARFGVDEDRFLLSTAKKLSLSSLASAVRHTVTHGHGLPEGTERQKIGAFVIDIAGVVQYQFVADSILDELPTDELIRALQALPPRRF